MRYPVRLRIQRSKTSRALSEGIRTSDTILRSFGDSEISS